MGNTPAMELQEFLECEKLRMKLQGALDRGKKAKFSISIRCLHKVADHRDPWRQFLVVEADPCQKGLTELTLQDQLKDQIQMALGDDVDHWSGSIRLKFSPVGRSSDEFDSIQQKLAIEEEDNHKGYIDPEFHRYLINRVKVLESQNLSLTNGYQNLLTGAGAQQAGTAAVLHGAGKVVEASKGPAPVSAGAELVKALTPVATPIVARWLEAENQKPEHGRAQLPPEDVSHQVTDGTQQPGQLLPPQQPAEFDPDVAKRWAREHPQEAFKLLAEGLKESGISKEMAVALLQGALP